MLLLCGCSPVTQVFSTFDVLWLLHSAEYVQDDPRLQKQAGLRAVPATVAVPFWMAEIPGGCLLRKKEGALPGPGRRDRRSKERK